MTRLSRLLLLLALAGCKSTSSTAIVVELWSDLRVPSQIDAVRIDAAGAGMTSTSTSFVLGQGAGRRTLPFRVSLVPADESDQHVRIEAAVMQNGVDVVVQVAELDFRAGEILLLRMDLNSSCQARSVNCMAGTTCSNGKCVDPAAVGMGAVRFDPSMPFPPRDGGPPDGSSPDRPPDAPGPDRPFDLRPPDLVPDRIPDVLPGIGQPCPDNRCGAGTCVDGVCCETSTCPACKSCAVPGRQGRCNNMVAGATDTDCVRVAASTCGLDGSCDGNGSCRKHSDGTVCTQAVCNGSTFTAARTCDGNGMCRTVTNASCAPYLCDTAARMCKGSCTTSTADCLSPNICTSGSCGLKRNGIACTANNQCASGDCVDNFCCESTCVGSCRACGLPGFEGMCRMIPTGQDPGNDCAPDGANACGTDGECDGAGKCRLRSASTVCAPAKCDAATGTFTASASCDGAGTCGSGASALCAPFACTSTGCNAPPCTGDSQCLSPKVCDLPTGMCQ